MIVDPVTFFWTFCIFIILIFIIGLYCIFVSYNLIRVLIGLEILIKAVTLLIAVVGYTNNHLSMTQAFIITLIVVEVVFIAVAAGVVLGLYRHNKNLDTRNLRNLKG